MHPTTVSKLRDNGVLNQRVSRGDTEKQLGSRK